MQCLNKWTDSEVIKTLKNQFEPGLGVDDAGTLHTDAHAGAESIPDSAIESGNKASISLTDDSNKVRQELVDNNAIEQLIRDTSIDIVPELLEFYVAESEKLMVQIGEAYDNKDAEKLEFHVHTLGSSSGSHAAMPLHFLARKIEHLCRENKAEEGFDLVDELKTLAKQSFSAITEKSQQLRQQ